MPLSGTTDISLSLSPSTASFKVNLLHNFIFDAYVVFFNCRSYDSSISNGIPSTSSRNNASDL